MRTCSWARHRSIRFHPPMNLMVNVFCEKAASFLFARTGFLARLADYVLKRKSKRCTFRDRPVTSKKIESAAIIQRDLPVASIFSFRARSVALFGNQFRAILSLLLHFSVALQLSLVIHFALFFLWCSVSFFGAPSNSLVIHFPLFFLRYWISLSIGLLLWTTSVSMWRDRFSWKSCLPPVCATGRGRERERGMQITAIHPIPESLYPSGRGAFAIKRLRE